MRKLLFFLVFFIIGFIVALGLVYLFGFMVSKFGIALYESEFDQQRNFNIVLVFVILFSSFSGTVGLKKYT